MDTLRSTQIIIMISTRRIHAEVACPHPHVVYGWVNYGLTGGCVVAYAAVWIVAVQVQAHSGHGTGSQPQTPPAYPVPCDGSWWVFSKEWGRRWLPQQQRTELQLLKLACLGSQSLQRINRYHIGNP